MITSKSYHLPEAESICFFRDIEKFCRHVGDHFCNFEEFWYRLWGKEFLQLQRQKLQTRGVRVEEDFEELYDKVVETLDAGIRFSISLPLYVRYQAAAYPWSGRKYYMQGYVFLSKWGFKIIVDRGCVVSAYFMTKTPDDSYYTLFKSAWNHIKTRCANGAYRDDKGKKDVKYLQTEMVNPKNWDCCPNPHKKVRPKRKHRLKKWVDQIENNFYTEDQK